MYCAPPMPDEPNPWTSYNSYICCANLNEPAWFLCCLQFYWMIFPWCYRWISKASTARVIGLFCFCLAWTLFWPIFLSFDWGDLNDWGRTLPTVQAYHPLSHVHKFVFGMCVGKLLVDFYAV